MGDVPDAVAGSAGDGQGMQPVASARTRLAGPVAVVCAVACTVAALTAAAAITWSTGNDRPTADASGGSRHNLDDAFTRRLR